MKPERMNQVIHEQIRGKTWHTEPSFQCIYCKNDVASCPPNPDYTTDLNAVALAEAKVCEIKGHKAYGEALLDGFCATALQRAAACLRTMDLWEADDEQR